MLPAAGEARRATSSPTTTSAMELLAEQVEIARGDRLVHVVVDVGDREVSGRIEAGMQIVEIHSSEGYYRVIPTRINTDPFTQHRALSRLRRPQVRTYADRYNIVR